ncbi:MAG: di-trans,poly-cis-decaprenylcistransferase [Candidatus Nealsonbacteria bacterium]|nr:di-trans,poly-cis-decaprenylcistransferase [Candidatus Nealsonbacteria bacterium]
MSNIPKHVAIIPDGNRRWARKKGLKAWIGHQQGTKGFEKILEKAKELNISYITFWAGSWDNLTKRPKKEVDFLFKLYKEHFERIVKDKEIHKSKVKVNVIGRWREILPKKVKEAINKALVATKNYHNYFLTFLLAYNGTDEMQDCIKKISKLNKKKINKSLIKENLWTKDLPPVDLLIRTGCDDDPHSSAGFMMWDTAYSQFHFTKTFFPDFNPKEFEMIIDDYSKRERRLGA